MTMQSQIREHMPIKLVSGQDHGVVDRLDGEYIKSTHDETGQHHWIPLSLVDHVDEHVHLKVDEAQLHQQWLSEDPHPQHRQ